MKKYTLEDALKAKEELIKLGMPENDFYFADEIDTECGFLLGEPLLADDDFAVSAYRMYTDKLFWDEHEDNYIDFILETEEK